MTRAAGTFGPNNGGDGRGPVNTRPFTPRRSETPRKVRGGIKLQGILQRDDAPTSAEMSEESSDVPGIGPAKQLLAIVQSMIDPAVWAEGLVYARAGQVVSIDFQHGGISAQVQGTVGRPYLTQITWPVFTDEQWQRIVESMAGEAVHVAKLLAGAWPASIEQRLESQGLPLLPTDSTQLTFSCTCMKDQSQTPLQGCKHMATTALLAAEALAIQPQHLFTWRGRSPELLMDHLRSARMVRSNANDGRSAETRSNMLIAEAPLALPLEACLDDFWRSPVPATAADQLSDKNSMNTSTAPHAPHALLRRMGPSPMNGRFPMVGLLASIYDEVSAAARRMRDVDPSDTGVVRETPDDSGEDDQ